MKAEALRIDADRLMRRLERLAGIGAIDGGGCCRLALTDEDRAGRDLVVGWMRELGLEVRGRSDRQRLRHCDAAPRTSRR